MRIIRFPKPRQEYIPEKNRFFTGIMICIPICMVFWALIAYCVFR